MAQRSFFWNGVTIGDADAWVVATADGVGYHMSNPYVVSPWVDIVMRSLLNGTGNRGVLKGSLSELEVSGVASPVTVDTGSAIIYGLFYQNDAAKTFTIATPTHNPRYDRVVVRRDWTIQEARITILTGTEGGGAPAMTQSPAPDGSGLYDIPLATLHITTGGVITIANEREYCTFSTVPVDGSIETTHIIENSGARSKQSTRTKRLFIGGHSLEGSQANGFLTHNDSGSYWNNFPRDAVMTRPTSFPGIMPPPGWEKDIASAYRHGTYGNFKVPSDWAGGAITPYLWWYGYSTTVSIYWQSIAHVFRPGYDIQYLGYGSTYLSSSTIEEKMLYRTARPAISGLNGDELIQYYTGLYNTSGTERAMIVGLEFQYTGYL